MTLNDFRQARSGAKRAAILGAARASFTERGFSGASTLDVAKQAGVSTATLYRHFPTKLDLFSAVLREAVEELSESLATTGAGGLDALCAAYAALLSTPSTRSLVRLAITSGDPALAERFYEAGKAATATLFITAVREEVAGGRVTDEADPGQLMGMIEHPTLLLGLLAGDDRPTARPPEAIAAAALKTWRSAFGQNTERRS